MFDQLGRFSDLLKNAHKLREALEAKAAEARNVRAEASSGGGGVTAVAGDQRLVSLRIDPELIADGDVELIEELVLEAANQALEKAREAVVSQLSSVTGDYAFPGLDELFKRNQGKEPKS